MDEIMDETINFDAPKKDVHIGSLIELVFKTKNISKSEFARRINRHRSDIYYIFGRESINTQLLISISKVLEFDFFKEIKSINESTQKPPF
jgi:plasmid maintenance system antidote protein VapI